MPQSYTCLLFHCIFSSKDRLPQIDVDLRPPLHAYMGGIVRALDGVALSINGVDDHVHLLLSLPPKVAITDAMRMVKANSSKWVHETFPDQKAFAWQSGYGAFTVSASSSDDVKAYIANQEEHHKRVSFQEEFLAFLKKHQVPYDPKWIWQ